MAEAQITGTEAAALYADLQAQKRRQAAEFRVQRFLDTWEHYRPHPLAGDGEIIISWPGLAVQLRRSDLLTLLSQAGASSDE